MSPLVGFLRTRGLQRGVFGDSRMWLGVWVGITAARFLSRVFTQPAQVERISLKPGQAIEIRDTGVTWGEERKRNKKKK